MSDLVLAMLNHDIDKSRISVLVGRRDKVRLVLDTHQELERLLLALLMEALPGAQKSELEKLSFPLKVGILRASGIMRDDFAAGLVILNKWRNRLAHQANQRMLRRDGVDIYNALPATYRAAAKVTKAAPSRPVELLRTVAAFALVQARGLCARFREQQACDQVLVEMINETVSPSDRTSPGTQQVEKEIQIRVAQKLLDARRHGAP